MNKTFKIYRFAPLCFGAMTLLATLASCSKDDEPTIEPESLSISTDTLIFTGSATAQSFNIESTGSEWAIEISETGIEWLNVTPQSGKSGKTEVNVLPQAYSDDFNRYAHLLISKNGEVQKRIGISQSGATHTYSRLQDSLSLVTLYKATEGHNWYGDSRSTEFPWDIAKPMTSWAGVETEVINGEHRVTSLDLSRVAGMKGNLPKELGYISELKALLLAADALVGEVPRQLTLLTNLETLYISAAQSSSLKWEPTDEYKNLTKLNHLYISNIEPNDITTNPISLIYQLPSIKILSLGLPYVSGAMPSGISALSNLEELTLYMPNISSLPSDMGELTKLKKLSLSANKVSQFPGNISNWKSLEEITISKVRSSFTIPTEFKELVNLKVLGLGSLGISFNPNEMLTNMSKLEKILLNYNKLNGSINWLAGKPNLEMLQIDQNEGVLEGEIPSEIYSYSNLSHFVITSATTTKNNITGNLDNIDKLTKLTTFLVTNANLTGEVKLPNNNILYYFDVSNNNLTGGIQNVVLAESLFNFVVFGNKLSGDIPTNIHDVMWDFNNGNPPSNEVHRYSTSAICPQQEGFGFNNCHSFPGEEDLEGEE
ncbi:MAG: leucine-rich repeat domain-containing protein [Bacteroidales bacterium]